MNDFRLPADEAVLTALNGLGWDWLDSLWVALSNRGFGIGTALLLGGWLLATQRKKALRPVLQAALACVLADAIGHNLLKPYFNRIRPHLCLPSQVVRHWAEAAATGPSLPSLHAATSFAFAVGLGCVLPQTLRLTLPLAVLISVSRIGVGVHWPSDVLAGAVLGAIVALLIHLLFQRWWPKPGPLAS